MGHGIIQDGRGSGNSAEVDNHGRLYTRANVIGHMSHHATYHKNGYIGVFNTTLADGTISPCAFLQNSDNANDIEIYWLKISSDADMEIDIISDNDYSAGGATSNMFNTNLAHPVALSATIYQGGGSGDLVLTTTHNFAIDGFFLGAHRPHCMDYDGGIVLGLTRSIAVKATGAAGNKVKVMMGFALHSKDTKL